MRCITRSPFTALLLCAALTATAAFGQSLSIVKKAENDYRVEANAPADNPHVLQESASMHLWVDIQDSVQDPFSFQFDTTDVSQRYFRLIPEPPEAPPIRVLLLGDSMTADGSGWGSGVYGYFKPNATVVNYATSWASTKVFLQSDEYQKMLLIQPNYVLMEYGFMDGATDPDRSTTPTEFAANLKIIIEAVRSFNGIPVLITLHSARLFDDQGKVIPTWKTTTDIVKQVSAELNTPLIDLNKLSFDLITELGQADSAFMNLTPDDLMHLSPLGAQYHARLILNHVPDALGPYLTGIFDLPPKP